MTDTDITNLIINEMTTAQAQANISTIDEHELILTTDKNIPVPSSTDNGKVVQVVDGDYALETLNIGNTAHVQQVDMTAIIEQNKIKAYLDDTLAGFVFENAGLYRFNIILPTALLTLDLPNAYVIELYDNVIANSSTANKIVLNNIFHTSNITSATVGDMCSLQNYDINTGVEWVFNARYAQFVESGTTYRVAYTSDVIRESNPSMTGADLYVAVLNNTLKTGTSVYCLSDYTNGTISYSAGTMYKVTGEVIGGDLIIDVEEQHDMTREDVSHKKSTIIEATPSTTDYPNEYAVVNYSLSKTGSNASATDITALHSVLNNMPQVTAGNTITGKQAVIVDSYLSSDGLTWYKVWSDGWKECGIITTSNNTSNKAVALPITFSNTNYFVLDSVANSSTQLSSRTLIVDESNVTITAGNQGVGYNSATFRIYCCGY